MATLVGTAYWASITTPNTKFEPVYSLDLVVDDKTADEFRAKGYTVKDKEYGPTLVIKRKVNKAKGGTRPAPRLVDKNNNQIDVAIGNGSTVKVQYKEWESTFNGQNFLGLELQAVQILDLIEYGSPDGSEFSSEGDDEVDFGA